MASLGKRDIDMIFRAETDSAQRNIGDLKKAVRDLTGDLAKQTAAIARGEGSYESLAESARELKRAQDELGTARSLLTNLNTLVGQEEKAATKTAKLRTELAELKAQLDGASGAAKQLTTRVDNKSRAVEKAAADEAKLTAEIAEQRQQIEAIIGPVNNIPEAFRTIARTSKEAAQGLAVQGQAMDDLKAKQAALASGQTFDQQAARSPVDAETIAFISQFENRIERLRQEEEILERQRVASSAAEKQRRASLLAGVNEVLQGNERLQSSFRDLAADEAKLEQANGFRAQAAQARAAFTDVDRFGAAQEMAAASSKRLADEVQKIIAPAAAAANSLETVGEQVDRAADTLDNKKANFRDYGQALNDAEQAQAALNRQAKQVDGLRDQERAVLAAERAFEGAQDEVLSLAAAISKADEPTEEMARALGQAENNAERLGNQLGQERTKLNQLGIAAKKAGIDVNSLDAAEKRIIDTSRRAAVAADGLRTKLGGGGNFLGLDAFSLQNLTYQINDVFQGLAQGIRPTQILAQQGPQIAQIPGLLAKLVSYLPLLVAIAIPIATIATGLSRAAQQAERINKIGIALRQVDKEAEHSAESIAQVVENLDDLGASSEDALKIVTDLIRDGFDPKVIEDFGVAALNMAEITGEELPEAAEKLQEAFSGGKDEILALNDEFPFLTKSERDQIKAMDDSTDAADIRTLAFDAFYEKARELNAELEGPGVQASDTLSKAWDDLLDTLAITSAYETILDYFADIKLGIAGVINFISVGIRQLQSSFGKLAAAYQKGGFLAALGSINEISRGEKSFDELVAEAGKKTFEQFRSSRGNRARSSSGDPGAGSSGARNLAESEAEKAAKEAEKKRKKASDKAAKEAERLAKQLESDTERLTTALDRMTSQALKSQTGTIEEQLENQRLAVEKEYAKLFRDLDDFTKQFGANQTIGGLTQADYRAKIEANKTLLVQSKQLGVFEEAINDLQKERNERLSLIEDQQKAGLKTAVEAFNASKTVTNQIDGKMEDAVAKAREFALALSAAGFSSPELDSFLAKLDRTTAQIGQAGTQIRQIGLADYAAGEQKINDIISDRDGLLAANNTLVELGLKTAEDARRESEAAFNATSGRILESVTAQRALLDQLRSGNNPVISEEFYQAELARLEALVAQAQYVDSRIVQVNQAANQAFVNGFTSMFDTLARGLANLITEGGNVGDLFENLGYAALEFAANFLQAISQVLVQMLALQAVKSILGAGTGGGIGGLIFGGFHGGTGAGGVGSYGSGRWKTSRVSAFDAVNAIASAPRYHEGTQGAGLKSNEMMAVLEKGEKVLTEEQQRQAARQASGGNGSLGAIRNVVVLDDEDLAQSQMGAAGEKVFVTHARANVDMLKQLVNE